MTKSRGIGRGGARRGAGRKPGSHNPHTRLMLAELDRHRDLAVEDVLPSVFLKRVMLDEAAPLPARIMCAARVIPFVERRPAAAEPGEIPLMRFWSDEMLDAYEKRLREDMLLAPGFYGPAFFKLMGMPWPRPKYPDNQGFTPNPKRRDPWFAQLSRDFRGGGTGTPWAQGEREELLELARQKGLAWANGEDPDPAA